MADEELFFVRDRHLDFPVFDVDNHMYENTEAFTKYSPRDYEGLVRYIEEGNRTRLVVKDRIERSIPNPTFTRVAPPGGKDNDPLQRRSIAGLDAFYDVEPRYKLMQEYGIGRALMWPTLGSVSGRTQSVKNSTMATLSRGCRARHPWLTISRIPRASATRSRSRRITSLPLEHQKLVMGGTLARLLNVE